MHASNKAEAEAELDRLANKAMELAHALLIEQGGFIPFAVTLTRDGNLEEFNLSPEGHEDANDLLDRLELSLAADCHAGKYRAVAFVADSAVQVPGKKQRLDAIRVGIEHVQGFYTDLYMTYRRVKSGELKQGELFSTARVPVCFGE